MQQATALPSTKCSRPQPAPHTHLAARCQHKPFTSTRPKTPTAEQHAVTTSSTSRRQLLSGTAAVLAAVTVPAWQTQPAQVGIALVCMLLSAAA